jgi:hypothetical protein
MTPLSPRQARLDHAQCHFEEAAKPEQFASRPGSKPEDTIDAFASADRLAQGSRKAGPMLIAFICAEKIQLRGIC